MSIRLRMVTDNQAAFEMFPIVPASDVKPDWLSKMRSREQLDPEIKSVTTSVPTLKACTGIRDTLETGFILRAWADFSIIIYPDGGFQFSQANAAPRPSIEIHARKQYEQVWANHTAIKLVSPWAAIEETGCRFMAVPPAYHSPNLVKHFMPHGILDFKYQHAVNPFILAEWGKEPYEIFISAGTPLLHLVPITDKKTNLVLERGDPTKHTYNKNVFLVSQYRRMRKFIDDRW